MRAVCARTANLNGMHKIMCTIFIIQNFFSNSKNHYNKQFVHIRSMKAKILVVYRSHRERNLNIDNWIIKLYT